MIASGTLNVVAAALFLFIAVRMSGRTLEPRSRPAQRSFVVWWLCVAAFLFVWHAAAPFVFVADVTALGVFVVLRFLSYLVISAGIAALVYFLLYLYTGRRNRLAVVSVYYTLVFLALAYLVVQRGPVGVDTQTWRIDLVYEVAPSTLYHLALALLILPAVGAGIGYFLLRFRTSDPYIRFRVTLVSWSIIIWALSSLLARIYAEPWWQLLTRSGIGLIAAAVILFAYDTPEAVRRRLGARTFQEGEKREARWRATRARYGSQRRERRQAGLKQRMEDLL